jgi:hypothetical protein
MSDIDAISDLRLSLHNKVENAQRKKCANSKEISKKMGEFASSMAHLSVSAI